MDYQMNFGHVEKLAALKTSVEDYTDTHHELVRKRDQKKKELEENASSFKDGVSGKLVADGSSFHNSTS